MICRGRFSPLNICLKACMCCQAKEPQSPQYIHTVYPVKRMEKPAGQNCFTLCILNKLFSSFNPCPSPLLLSSSLPLSPPPLLNHAPPSPLPLPHLLPLHPPFPPPSTFPAPPSPSPQLSGLQNVYFFICITFSQIVLIQLVSIKIKNRIKRNVLFEDGGKGRGAVNSLAPGEKAIRTTDILPNRTQ